MININQISNEKIELYEEDGRYFLRCDFDYEDRYAYYKGHIERIVFDFRLYSIKEEDEGWSRKISVDLGIGKDLTVLPDADGNYFTITVVKEKTYEMTMEEIEKKLGHKVKIITKK